MGKFNDYDDDDFRNRKYVNNPPLFYLKAVYNAATDMYDIRPFIWIDTGDRNKQDFVESPVKERHIVQYRREYQDFQNESTLPRESYTREEMMCVPDYRDRYEYNQRIVGLLPSHPDYLRIISDFSVKLRPTDLYALRRLDGIDAPAPQSEPVATDGGADKNDAILVVLRELVGQVRDLGSRVATIENKQKE